MAPDSPYNQRWPERAGRGVGPRRGLHVVVQLRAGEVGELRPDFGVHQRHLEEGAEVAAVVADVQAVLSAVHLHTPHGKARL